MIDIILTLFHVTAVKFYKDNLPDDTAKAIMTGLSYFEFYLFVI